MATSSEVSKSSASIGDRGRYRVTINGFTVNEASWDDALQWDGKGDEVFICAEVRMVDKTGNPLIKSSTRSKIMGDTNNFSDRIRAGTVSPLGGLQRGDVVPSNPPWQRVGNPQPDRPPMLAFEGELIQGQHAVAIAPSIWEWDGGGDIFNDLLRCDRGEWAGHHPGACPHYYGECPASTRRGWTQDGISRRKSGAANPHRPESGPASRYGEKWRPF